MADDKIRIRWFPGHMTKAKREMQEKLNTVDTVIELRDTRIPSVSKNSMIEELCQSKPRLIVLSKEDKVDVAAIKLWCNALQNETIRVVALSILKENIIPGIVEESHLLMQAKIEHMKRRGIHPRAIRAMIVGVPNVGKSTFISRISKKKVAVTGDRPDVTKALQWSKVSQNLGLLDTSGVLWPKLEDETVGVLLAITGAICDETLPLEEIAAWAIRYLIANKKEALQQHYEIAVCEDPYIMLERIAEKRGFMRKGEMGEKRTIEAFLWELRDDRLGRITWEMPYADSE